jgi:hypothetical protein
VFGSGVVPDDAQRPAEQAGGMPSYLLHHQHEPADCATAFAAWAGFESPLRHQPAASTCMAGGHAVWWRVQAQDRAAALGLLPPYVAERTTSIEIREIEIP